MTDKFTPGTGTWHRHLAQVLLMNINQGQAVQAWRAPLGGLLIFYSLQIQTLFESVLCTSSLCNYVLVGM